MKQIIEKLLSNISLTQEESHDIMLKIMSGEFNDAQISGFLIALRAKGESSSEIAGFAQAMRDKMTKIESVDGAIDMCGTGGDASGTFNISTAASFVVAGAGIPVAKHGNRSMTSKSGSADVLTELGVDITLPPEKVSECIAEIGIGFMFAPSLHPAMKYAMGARVALGTRTVFNILGPLCNPAGVTRQLMGIFDGSLTDKVAKVLQKLGSEHAMIVHGYDGLDEISTTASTKISHLKNNGEIESMTISSSDYGFEKSTLEVLKGGTPDVNAKIISAILDGSDLGMKADIVILNAAAGIFVGGKADNMETCVDLAKESITSGAAKEKLDLLALVK
ncbi:MAG: anthranilate phosphoribosyltransferase [Candidatus Marinimicrobia bacterium]|jgi:anthranilate phosphoribosyltransferase|nr:anthranilate phosphoribosyltransferase [Candidatus Neomarinimicrobiota bacterium]MBT5956533.1 anthranilate phosphoribosyltransferase [Candidatus Neomarinimicrobiota bacterium]MBT6871306.1 anthranilate phosphoribosyltransferase [Candidatus Neomarinimicrobiota bacterium]MBT7377428.1 anthranilate phosphoribosyltransferase [Candidatus Neomarinimicrobiota bacterium]